MSAEWQNFRTVCAVIAAYRRKHRSWPNRAMLPRQLIQEIQRELGAEDFAKVTSRIRLFPSSVQNILVYDEQCQIVDTPEAATEAEIAEIQQWLGIKKPGAGS